MFRIEPAVYFMLALLVLVLPLDWLAAALIASAFHELCHFAAIQLLGGRVHSFTIGPGGAVIDAAMQKESQEFWCTFAGPAGSFVLVALYRLFPKLSICAAVQGLFNLLPIYPLDGGRMLRCIFNKICPGKAGKIETAIKIAVILLVIAGAVGGAVWYSLGILPAILLLGLPIKGILRKRPCKQGKNRVQ